MNEFKTIGNLTIMYVLRMTETHKVILDTEDVTKVRTFHWLLLYGRKGKRTHIGARPKYPKHIILSRFILGITDPNLNVLFANENVLDHRKANLIVADKTTAGLLVPSSNKSNKSGARGVSFNTATGKWMAQIMFKRKPIYLGVYLTVEEASAVVEAKRKELTEEVLKQGRTNNE